MKIIKFLAGTMVMVVMIVTPFTVHAGDLKKVTTSKRVEVEKHGVTIKPTPREWQAQPRIQITVLKTVKTKFRGEVFWTKEKLVMMDGAIPGNPSQMAIDRDGEVDFLKLKINGRVVFKERYMQKSPFDQLFQEIVDKKLGYPFPQNKNRENAEKRIHKLLQDVE